MKKALVTGANGFIGSALVRELVNNGIEVIALDREGCNGNIPDEAKFVPFDLDSLADITPVLTEYKPEIYYHLAWLGMNDTNRIDARIQLKNVEWSLAALKQAADIGCTRFVGAGSITEYEALESVFIQGAKLGGSSIYGTAKLTAHAFCMIEAERLGIEIVWSQIANSYGVGDSSLGVINSTLRKILSNEPLEFTSGTQNYDFVYIDETARALRLIGENGKPFYHYLIGSSHAKPLKEFLLEIKETVAQDKEFVFGALSSTRANLPLESFDCSLTEKDTGFKSEISFSDGIRRTYEWLKNIQKT